MDQHRLSAGPLLDGRGRLCEAGYGTSLVREYRRDRARGGPFRTKEWDYYLVYNGRFGLALTIADNSYMGLISASFLDFENAREKTVSPMFFFPAGNTRFPANSAAGDVSRHVKDAYCVFLHENGGRRLKAAIPNFDGGEPLTADVFLSGEPQDSMVIATPFAEKPTAFYYNQKIVGMRAEGRVSYRGAEYRFDKADSFGMLDWGRGVWTYDNTWYWSAGHGLIDGRVVGFNLGYGFGDTSAASENMLFVGGKAHKLDRVEFHIPRDASGRDDYLSEWAITSSDGRFMATFSPLLDRAACTKVGPLLSDQHQVFGYMDGAIRLDGGETIELNHFLAMAEKVRNKW